MRKSSFKKKSAIEQNLCACLHITVSGRRTNQPPQLSAALHSGARAANASRLPINPSVV